MHWLAGLGTLNLIDVFNYYLILVFVVSTGLRVRTYRSVVGLICAGPSRWPKLLVLVHKHRTIFLGWPMLVATGFALVLLLGNSAAIHWGWVQAQVTFTDLWGSWPALLAVGCTGGAMLVLDGQATFRVGSFDRGALEADLDKAESWLKSWMAPAVRIATLGFIHPRRIVGAEVERLLVAANWLIIGGMWRTSLRLGMQLAFGLSLWLTWAFALRQTA